MAKKDWHDDLRLALEAARAEHEAAGGDQADLPPVAVKAPIAHVDATRARHVNATNHAPFTGCKTGELRLLSAYNQGEGTLVFAHAPGGWDRTGIRSAAADFEKIGEADQPRPRPQ